jgi:hypothetical protein
LLDACGVASADIKLLQTTIIPSWPGEEAPPEAFLQPENWIAKYAYSGKGDGLVFGGQVTPAIWQRTCTAEVVLQPIVEQQEILWQTDALKTLLPGTVAGTIPVIEGRCYGPGIARIYTKPHVYRALAQPLFA